MVSRNHPGDRDMDRPPADPPVVTGQVQIRPVCPIHLGQVCDCEGEPHGVWPLDCPGDTSTEP